MFSVICHIHGRKNRLEHISMFKNLLSTHGEIIINVSTPASLPEEVITYELLRKQRALAIRYRDKSIATELERALKLALESGDLYYSKEDGQNYTHAFGHAYTAKELKLDMEQSGLAYDSVKIMSIGQPYDISKGFIQKHIDSILSAVLSLDLPFYPFNHQDSIAKNIYIVAKLK
jgi:hypothetical protein